MSYQLLPLLVTTLAGPLWQAVLPATPGPTESLKSVSCIDDRRCYLLDGLGNVWNLDVQRLRWQWRSRQPQLKAGVMHFQGLLRGWVRDEAGNTWFSDDAGRSFNPWRDKLPPAVEAILDSLERRPPAPPHPPTRLAKTPPWRNAAVLGRAPHQQLLVGGECGAVFEYHETTAGWRRHTLRPSSCRRVSAIRSSARGGFWICDDESVRLVSRSGVLAAEIALPGCRDLAARQRGSFLAIDEQGCLWLGDEAGRSAEPLACWQMARDSARLAVSRGDTVLVVASGGFSARSRDGGRSWTLRRQPWTGSLAGLWSSQDGTELTLANREGRYWQSRDTGTSWRFLRDCSRPVLAVDCRLEGHVLVPCGRGVSRPDGWSTAAQSSNEQGWEFSLPAGASTLVCLDHFHLLLATGQDLLFSANSGQNWERLQLPSHSGVVAVACQPEYFECLVSDRRGGLFLFKPSTRWQQ